MFGKKRTKNIITIVTTLLVLGLNLYLLSAPAQATSLFFNNIEVKKINNNKLTVAWSTNMPAQGWLQIRQTESGWGQTAGNTNFDNYHEITVTLPQANTTYFYKIIAETNTGERIVSLEFNVKIDKFVDTTRPKFKSKPQLLYADNTHAVIIWTTDEKSTGKLKYSTDSNLANSKTVNAKTDKGFNAKATIENLRPNTTYYYEVTITDQSGNYTRSATLTFITRQQADNEPLKLLKQQPLDNNSNNIKDVSATISWQISRPAVCELQYGLKGKSKKKIRETGWGSLEHEFLIEGLAPGQEYAYRIYCTDILNKKMITEDIVFKTRRPKVLGYQSESDNQTLFGQNYRLVKTASDPRVYVISNKQKYLIKTPSIFKSYGFKWSEIKTISAKELNRYKTANLIKTANRPSVYFIYQNLGRKKVLLNESAFRSYRNNAWSDIIIVSQQDLDSYPDIVLVKEKNNSTVYLLQGTIKRPIKNMAALRRHNLQYQPIGIVSRQDLNSYYSGPMLE